MYGTRRAAEGWQDEYSGSLVELGFTQGSASPCVFHHESKGIMVSVHGDDFTAAGPKSSLDWFESEMRKKYELTVGGRLGPGRRDDKEATVLNRVIRWTPTGIEHEADPRQVERLLEGLELEGEGVKGVVTPGVKVTAHQLLGEVEMAEREHTRFRGLAARANYLSADRPDIIFAAKEICRLMAKPTDLAMAALKRLGRYLRHRPRLVFSMGFQTASHWDVYTDTDWAGCTRTRKSTSGGCLMLGEHVIKCWSATQASLALSSGEAEYYGVVRGTGVGLGQQALGRDGGFCLPIRVWTDSSAAMGTAARQGLGKLRHLECHSLWVQQRLRRKEFELRKVLGTDNPADLFTKHMDSAAKLDGLVSKFGCSFREGRPAAAPQLKRVHAMSLEEPLPHLLPPCVMERRHARAEPDVEILGEPDKTPEEELHDPVPRIAQARLRMQALGKGALVPRRRARADNSLESAARAVGECLDVKGAEAANSCESAAPRVGQVPCSSTQRTYTHARTYGTDGRASTHARPLCGVEHGGDRAGSGTSLSGQGRARPHEHRERQLNGTARAATHISCVRRLIGLKQADP
jgi:hypothetical protein